MEKPHWIRDDVVLAIHRRQMAEHGGPDGIHDASLLAAALARPKNRFAYDRENTDLASLAAAYAFGIARDHPFVDSNKRTAYVVCRVFLKINGFDLVATAEAKYAAYLSLAAREITEPELANWIRDHLHRLP